MIGADGRRARSSLSGELDEADHRFWPCRRVRRVCLPGSALATSGRGRGRRGDRRGCPRMRFLGLRWAAVSSHSLARSAQVDRLATKCAGVQLSQPPLGHRSSGQTSGCGPAARVCPLWTILSRLDKAAGLTAAVRRAPAARARAASAVVRQPAPASVQEPTTRTVSGLSGGSCSGSAAVALARRVAVVEAVQRR